MKLMKNAMPQPGDRVVLAAVNGLGHNPFTVIEVDPRDIIHRLHVEGANGQRWWARLEGVRILPR